MPVIPLIVGRTVVTTEREFDSAGGRNGNALLIRNFDSKQLGQTAPNLSYDLRVGAEYKDHRDGWKRDIPEGEPIDLLPGGALIIETEESLHLPKGMFAYIVPRVEWLQKGVSNTSSKVDPGYNGRLLITLFNLGQKKQTVNRADRFCSLVIHDVGPNAVLYDKDAKKISGIGHRRVWQKIRDEIEANRTVVDLALIGATLVLTVAELHLYRAFHSLNEILSR